MTTDIDKLTKAISDQADAIKELCTLVAIFLDDKLGDDDPDEDEPKRYLDGTPCQ
jgi:hypothetical protein